MVTAGLQGARSAVRGYAGCVAALLLVLVGAVGCDLTSGTSATSNPSPSSPSLLRLESHDWLHKGAYAVGNLGCDGQLVAWTTGSQPLTKLNHRNDVIEVAKQGSSQPTLVATAQHGGTLTDTVAVTGTWIVYLEYQQHGQGSTVDFWYLSAVDSAGGSTVLLAAATSGVELQELPWYDAAGGRAVWDQLDAGGAPILRMYDFVSRRPLTLPIPAGAYPVQPTIAANSVVFVDNSTDPNRGHEDFLGRRGSLRRFDIDSRSLTTLSESPTAWMPLARADYVTWTSVPSVGPSTLLATHLAGGSITNLGSNPVTPVSNGETVVWYDSSSLHLMAYGTKSRRLVELQVGDWQDIRSVFAFCGSRLFFALPQAVDGGSTTIRYADLPISLS